MGWVLETKGANYGEIPVPALGYWWCVNGDAMGLSVVIYHIDCILA